MAKVSEIVRKIKKETDCYVLRQGASHEIWFNPTNGKTFSIPRHPAKEIKTGTARAILEAAGVL